MFARFGSRLVLPTMFAIAWSWAAGATAQVRSPLALEQARNRMVNEEVIAAGIKDPRVIQSMRTTPRHEFVSPSQASSAYYDMSLPIGEHQTISPPVIVAYMTEQLEPQATDRVLEIGTGSGYQAAVLSPLVEDVYSIEIVEALGKHAEQTLKRLKYKNVHTKIGDGYQGWTEHAPFDKIIVTCSPEKVPQALVDQLKEGGRMIIPVGERYQQVLYLFKKKDGKLVSEALRPTLFVPMTGTAEAARQVKPDPLHPKLVNGSFEESTGSSEEPTGWYYIRQMKTVTASDAPDGQKYVTFTNSDPGRGCRAMQGFALDGRKVHELEASCMVKGKDIVPGPTPDQLPVMSVTYYDENRGIVGRVYVGPWRGTFGWQQRSEKVKVPASTREAICHIGLFGATGEISYDNVQIKGIGVKE
jgi:protein-L-isoaspartate(D-aspartate) O-methyltransferase